jgi:hypothetical protein
VTDLLHPAIQRVVEVASRKGVALDIRLMPATTHTAEEAAAALDAELGQIVKSLVFVAPRPDGRLIPVVCLVSGEDRVDPALLAAVTLSWRRWPRRPGRAPPSPPGSNHSLGSRPERALRARFRRVLAGLRLPTWNRYAHESGR